MKRAMVCFVMVGMSMLNVAQAVPSVDPDSKENWRERCDSISTLAGSIMEARQEGIAMSNAMKIADGNKLAELMVAGAFDTPRYGTADYKKRTIEEFRDSWYLKCTKTVQVDKKPTQLGFLFDLVFI